jgi:spore germination cell wall hydrolase CwlJ-like protein
VQIAVERSTGNTMGERTERATSHNALANGATMDSRAARILAKAIYKEARGAGVEGPGLVAVATELLGLVAADMRAARQ